MKGKAKVLWQCFILLSMTTALVHSGSGQKQSGPLSVEDAVSALSFPLLTPIELSPDGNWLAYTLQDPKKIEPAGDGRYTAFSATGVPFRDIGSDVWIASVKTRESTNLTLGKGSSWGPSWSPDGKSLAFYSDRDGKSRIWLWERATGRLRRVSNATVCRVFGYEPIRWMLDNKKLVAEVLPEGRTVEDVANIIWGEPQKHNGTASPEKSIIVYSASDIHDGGGHFVHPYASDLAVIDTSSGATHRILRGMRVTGYWISPDSSAVAVTVAKGWESDTSMQPIYDLVMVFLVDTSSHTVASNIRQQWGMNVSWSPNGKLLSYLESGPHASGDCFVVSPNGGMPRMVTRAGHPNFAHPFRPPLWDDRGANLYFIASDSLWGYSVDTAKASQIVTIPNHRLVNVIQGFNDGRLLPSSDRRSIIVGTRNDDTKENGLYHVDLLTGQFTKVLEENRLLGNDFAFDFSRDGTLVFKSQGVAQGEDIWVANNDFRPIQLTHSNPTLERYVMGSGRLIQWTTTDGQKLQGALLLPSNYEDGKRYPLIVEMARGSNSINNFGLSTTFGNLQLFATRGYAVLLPDVPVRTGTPMRDIARAVLPGVDRVIELGIADADRLAVMGVSTGGYQTLALIVQTTRFKAAVSYGGWGNIFSRYSNLTENGRSSAVGWGEDGTSMMGGSPWQFRDRYIQNSPDFFLDKVHTPILLLHGAADTSVPLFLPNATFVGLRRLGKQVTYLQYVGEGHGIVGYFNRIDYLSRMIAWFDDHVKEPGAKKPE